MSYLTGSVQVNGLPRNGATVNLYDVSSFPTPPVAGDALPSTGILDTVTTSPHYGGDGSYRFTVADTGEWWVGINWAGYTVFEYFLRQGPVELINVKEFGAIGDGVTDDAPAIRLALANARNVFFPNGTYLINSFSTTTDSHVPAASFAFVMKSNQSLIGESGATIKMASGAVNSASGSWGGNFVLCSGTVGNEFRNIIFDGNGANNLHPGGGATRTCYVIYGDATSGIVIDDCTFKDIPGRNDILLQQYGVGAQITNNTFKNNGTSLSGNTNQNDHSYIYSTNSFSRIAGNHILPDNEPNLAFNSTAYLGGIEVHNSNIEVVDNVIKNCYPAVYIVADAAIAGAVDTTDVIVSRNRFESCLEGIIFPTNPGGGNYNRLQIHDNIFTLRLSSVLSDTANPKYGIHQSRPSLTTGMNWTFFAFLKNVSIRGNIFFDLDTPNANNNGRFIYLHGVSGCAISNNQFHGSPGNSMVFLGHPSGTTGLLIENNLFNEWGTNTTAGLAKQAIFVEMTGSAATPSKAAYDLDGLSIRGNFFRRAASATGTTGYYFNWDAGSAVSGIDVGWNSFENVTILKNGGKAGAVMTPSYGTAVPTTGARAVGDIIQNTAPNANGVLYWVCTVSGTPGTWNAVYSRKLTTYTATPVTVLASDEFVLTKLGTPGAVAVSLPASPLTGKVYTIKDATGDAGSNNITVTPAAGNIDGAATKVISSNYGSVRLVYSGTEWSVV